MSFAFQGQRDGKNVIGATSATDDLVSLNSEPDLYTHPNASGASESDIFGYNVPEDLNGEPYVVVRVTNRNNDGSGSLREALTRGDIDENTTWRIVVFDVGGRFNIESQLTVNKSRTIIAGQTAPGHVEIWGHIFAIKNAEQIYVSHIGARLGGSGNDWNKLDSVTILDSSKVRFQNCSFANSDDEMASPIAGNLSQICFVDCLFGHQLKGPTRGDHRFGWTIRDGNFKMGFYRSIGAGTYRAQPRVSNESSFVMASNLLVACDDSDTKALAYEEKPGNKKLIALDWYDNEYIWPDLDDDNVLSRFDNIDNCLAIIFERNYHRDSYQGMRSLAAPESSSVITRVSTPQFAPAARLILDGKVLDFTMAHAGMRPISRDATDQLIIDEIITNSVPLKTVPVDNAPSDTFGTFNPSMDWNGSTRGRHNAILELNTLSVSLGGVDRFAS